MAKQVEGERSEVKGKEIGICCLKFLVGLVRKEGWKEGNAIFKDALNTFYLWLYGKGTLI